MFFRYTLKEAFLQLKACLDYKPRYINARYEEVERTENYVIICLNSAINATDVIIQMFPQLRVTGLLAYFTTGKSHYVYAFLSEGGETETRLVGEYDDTSDGDGDDIWACTCDMFEPYKTRFRYAEYGNYATVNYQYPFKEKWERELQQKSDDNGDLLLICKKKTIKAKPSFLFEKREGGMVLKAYKGDEVDIVIPRQIDEVDVVGIGENTFSPEAPRLKPEQKLFRSSIVSVKIPDSVKQIGDCAFENCKAICSVIIPNGMKEIGWRAFSGCAVLDSIEIPASVEKIGMSAFYNCPNLTIHAPAGSYAEQYAKENNIPFETI